MSRLTVLLSGEGGGGGEALRELLHAADFAVVEHKPDQPPPENLADFTLLLLDVGEHIRMAASQTRRWRIELGHCHLPLYWFLPETAVDQIPHGLNAGADVCLVWPRDRGHVAAQLDAAKRQRSAWGRQADRAAEARLLGDQLRRAYGQIELQQGMVQKLCEATTPRTLPRVGAVRFDVGHHTPGRSVGFHDVQRLDDLHVGFFVGEVMGNDSPAGGLLGLFARKAVRGKTIDAAGYRLEPPHEVLARVNRQLLTLGLEHPPFVAMLYGILNTHTGVLAWSRAGLPPPVLLSAQSDAELLAMPGAFLGVGEATFSLQHTPLLPGDRLLIGTHGTCQPGVAAGEPATSRLRNAAARHGAALGTPFFEALTQDLRTGASDDFTLLMLEFRGTPATLGSRLGLKPDSEPQTA